jgi:agmatinase
MEITPKHEIDCAPQHYENFMSIPPEYSGASASRFVVMPVPFETTTSYRTGTAGGPKAIIEASWQVELFDVEIGRRAYEAGIHTNRKLERCRRSFKTMYDSVKRATGAVLDADKIPVILGGEHTVTVPAVHAVLEGCPDLSVLQFDAHTDLRNEYDGSPWSHACAMRRLLSLADRPPRIVQAGLRSVSSDEWNLARRSRYVTPFLAKDIHSGKASHKDILDALGDKVYVTVDLDCFDPSEMPGVGTPEPGGLSWTWVCGLLEKVAAKRQILGFDIVELCPIQGQNISEFLAAKLAYRIMGLLV